MKYFIIAFTISILILFSISVFAVEQDKIGHITGSYMLTDVCLESGYTRKTCFWTAMLIGVLKESQDDNTPEEHQKDMIANIIGSSLSIATFRWRF